MFVMKFSYSLQPAFLLKRNSFTGIFWGFMFSFLVRFFDVIVIWRTPLLVKQLSTVVSKSKEDNEFTKFFVIVMPKFA